MPPDSGVWQGQPAPPASRGIYVDRASTSFALQGGVLFNRDFTILMRFPPRSPLANYNIPAGVQALAEGSFDDCTNLASIYLPDGLAEIGLKRGLNEYQPGFPFGPFGAGIFDRCPQLKSIVFLGDSPHIQSASLSGDNGWVSRNWGADQATVFFTPGSSGWGKTFGGRPTRLLSATGLKRQNISFHLPPGKVHTGPPARLPARASSGLPVSYVVSDPEVARVEGASNSATGNYLLVDGAGSVFSNRISITVGNGTNTDNRVNVTNGGVLHAGGLLNVHSNNRVNAAGSVWVGQDRPSVQTVNVLHTNANSNSVLTVNGLVAAGGTVTVGTRGVLGGAGIVQATETIIASGGTVGPGNSPGNLVVDGDLTWLGGGNYNWQIHDATGLAGTGWDYMPVIGALDLTALSSDSRFNINLWSLSAVSPDANGAAINFDNTLDGQSWDILFAIGGITGFDASDFNINVGSTNGTSGFANALAPGGFFGIEQNGNVLSLTYTVPEPSTYALLALAAAGLGAHVLRRRRR